MSVWSEGYVSDIGYTFGFYRELTPAILSFSTLVHKLSPFDPESALKYCELGCGRGFSANLLAAANPGIEFHAVDFNPSHIAGAQALARIAGAGNVQFHELSFSELARQTDLPRFDVIALHGVFSWVSAKNREAIVEFIRNRLNPGGVVYISYNVLPGWTSAMPLRRLLVDYAGQISGPTSSRIQRAIAFAQRLTAIKPIFFQTHTLAAQWLDKMNNQPVNYLAHEYFNLDLTPFYFRDVVKELEPAKVEYAGPAALLETLDVASLSPEQEMFLRDQESVIDREAIRDFITGQVFRRDVFVRGGIPLNRQKTSERWLELRFALTAARADISLRVPGTLREVTLCEEIYMPLIEAFSAGPLTGRQVLHDPKFSGIGEQNLIEALTVLVGLNVLQPALSQDGDGERTIRTQKFNSAVLEEARYSEDFQFLASPVTGGGIAVDRITQLFLLAAAKGEAEPVTFVWSTLRAAGHRLAVDGVSLDSDAENQAEISTRYNKFQTRQLSVLASLGIA